MDVNVCPPPEFIADVIDYISRRCDPGAILVFVPGIGVRFSPITLAAASRTFLLLISYFLLQSGDKGCNKNASEN